jgi:hypothetical protein
MLQPDQRTSSVAELRRRAREHSESICSTSLHETHWTVNVCKSEQNQYRWTVIYDDGCVFLKFWNITGSYDILWS